MEKYKVDCMDYVELSKIISEDDLYCLPNNRHGREYAYYFVIYYDGKILSVKSDAMAVEDALFARKLSWIKQELEKAYKLGVEDGRLSKD